MARPRVIDGQRDLDNLVSKNVLGQLRRDLPRSPAEAAQRQNAASTSYGDSDLLASMASRLSAAEKALKERNLLTARLQAENEALKSKLSVAEHEIAAARSMNTIEGAPAGEPAHLKAEVTRLHAQSRLAWQQVGFKTQLLAIRSPHQVAELKGFLNDYGMVWVGSSDPKIAGQVPVGKVQAGSRQDDEEQNIANSNGQAASTPNKLTSQPLVARTTPSSSTSVPALTTAAGKPQLQQQQYPQQQLHRVSQLIKQPSFNNNISSIPSMSAAGPFVSVTAAPHGAASDCSSSDASACPTGAGGSGAAGGDMRKKASTSGQLPFNLVDLQRSLTELNQIAGYGATSAVELIVYRDGLRFHNMPCRSYNEPTVKAIISDILDGYFPSVLKSTFPDGVPIMVVDCSKQTMNAASSHNNIHSFADIEQGMHEAPMSRGSFLSKLPQSVIRNGKVVEVRGGVSRILQGESSPGQTVPLAAVLVSTSADDLLSTVQRNHIGPSLPQATQAGGAVTEVTTLQVKSEDGQQTYIIKLQYEDTIASLRKYIDCHRAKQCSASPAAASIVAGATYEIRTSYPNRVYANGSETLQQAGLVPNATLFLKPMKAA